jgi:NADH:ubiquinone oxidoreductase subunit K
VKGEMLTVVGIMVITISLISIIKVTLTPININNGYIYILLSLELLLLGVSLIFISSALYMDDMDGIMTALYILTLGAAESAIGLSIITFILMQ